MYTEHVQWYSFFGVSYTDVTIPLSFIYSLVVSFFLSFLLSLLLSLVPRPPVAMRDNPTVYVNIPLSQPGERSCPILSTSYSFSPYITVLVDFSPFCVSFLYIIIYSNVKNHGPLNRT